MDNKIYQQVTDRIVAMLETGVRPWAKSWTGADGVTINGAMVRPLRSCGTPYTGINVLNLWAAATMRGMRGRHWMTFNTAKEKGGSVRKGAKAELAFYVGKHTVTEERNGQEQERDITFLRCYCVFNVDEIDGLPAHYYPDGEAPAPVIEAGRIPAADAFLSGTGAMIHHSGGNRAFYSPSRDYIEMPFFAQFIEPEAYYSTALHELVHWSGADDRLARGLGMAKRFGDSAYAAEELVAELGAAFACSDLGLSAEPREDHASYLANWLAVLKADNKAIFKAATLAEKAATYLKGLQPAGPAPEAPTPAPEAPAAKAGAKAALAA
jgi:antirestriction protein ArdC